ncbi:metal dependent phosphohydrolase [Mycobacteroides abscessus subsp. abscessus]|uniref:HD domain-containing protein n=1 Tax=Mycobacteroides abscessus TaxID=36809 RepID=UPI00092B16F3|nr:HD domain-containing protein [Mycobacteroides abscessus]SIH39247.1 metal dependent phosphohydrolase [Mycobacteroides abscessus subsp. abscessus]
MTTEIPAPRLTHTFTAALTYAATTHQHQTRKGGETPYLGHLLSVAALVIEAGGTETQCIAALLHDAPEDQGGIQTLQDIGARFGQDVERIVAQCSDTFDTPKPPWRERKQRYIEHLNDADDDTIVVSLADKVDNARAILRDFRDVGDLLWQRFSVNDPNDHLWYYRSLLDVYARRTDSWLVDDLRRTLDTLEELVDHNTPKRH